MDKLKALQPWQIIAIAVGALVIFAMVSYFIVIKLTSVKPTDAPPPVPANLNSEANQKITNKLQYFEVPRNLPLAPQPVETPDPNNPSTVNPFRP
jgi:hypothetical protein